VLEFTANLSLMSASVTSPQLVAAAAFVTFNPGDIADCVNDAIGTILP